MKKALTLALALLVMLATLTACGRQSTTSNTVVSNAENDITVSEDATSSTEMTSAEEPETTFAPVEINMEALVNAEADEKPIVEIHGDKGKTLFSFNFSEMATTKVEVTVDEKVEEGAFYITMAGNVTEHTLISDGSMFDGIVEIENGKAEFSVTYEGERKIDFIINVPNV